MEQMLTPRARRERPPVVTLTEAAAERVREIMSRAETPYAGLRVGVKNGGSVAGVGALIGCRKGLHDGSGVGPGVGTPNT